MSKAEERALEAYPIKNEWIDINTLEVTDEDNMTANGYAKYPPKEFL